MKKLVEKIVSRVAIPASVIQRFTAVSGHDENRIFPFIVFSEPVDNFANLVINVDEARLDSNGSILVSDTDHTIKEAVLADDGTWYGINGSNEFVKFDAPLDGYEVVSSLPFSFGGITGLHMTAGGDFVTG